MSVDPVAHPFVAVVAFGLGAAALATQFETITQEVATMEMQHWIMIIIIFAVGYAVGRLFPQAGQMVGLP